MENPQPPPSDSIARQASESVRAGIGIRERVHDLTLEALRSRRFDAKGVREVVQAVSEGIALGAESSMTKVFWSELDVRLHESALELLGPDAETDETGWMKSYQFALSGPIYAGTNEIQRNVIAERVLGLPRA